MVYESEDEHSDHKGEVEEALSLLGSDPSHPVSILGGDSEDWVSTMSERYNAAKKMHQKSKSPVHDSEWKKIKVRESERARERGDALAHGANMGPTWGGWVGGIA